MINFINISFMCCDFQSEIRIAVLIIKIECFFCMAKIYATILRVCNQISIDFSVREDVEHGEFIEFPTFNRKSLYINFLSNIDLLLSVVNAENYIQIYEISIFFFLIRWSGNFVTAFIATIQYLYQYMVLDLYLWRLTQRKCDIFSAFSL